MRVDLNDLIMAGGNILYPRTLLDIKTMHCSNYTPPGKPILSTTRVYHIKLQPQANGNWILPLSTSDHTSFLGLLVGGIGDGERTYQV